ncbi:MAG: hypothetical protein ACRDJC_12005 [Thermomicrobiales bacterium]
MSKYARRRQRLLSRGNTCHWCGVELVSMRKDRWPKGAMPPNFATLDHLRDRLTYPDRQHMPVGPEEQTVLACRSRSRTASSIGACSLMTHDPRLLFDSSTPQTGANFWMRLLPVSAT